MRKILIVFVLLLFILACNKDPEETASLLDAKLEPESIVSGQSSNLIIDAHNDGDLPLTLRYTISSESPENVRIQYPEELTFTLQPGETTGNKIIKVVGVSKTVRTDYLITVTATDESGETEYEEKDLILSVTS